MNDDIKRVIYVFSLTALITISGFLSLDAFAIAFLDIEPTLLFPLGGILIGLVHIFAILKI